MIKKAPIILRLLDYLMLPLMFALGGFKFDSIQETHPWHIQKVNPNKIDLRLATQFYKGNDSSRFLKRNLFLFHAPLLGGWKNYSVFEVCQSSKLPFYIGWIGHNDKDRKDRAYIQRLPIHNSKIRLLNGTSFYTNAFFAFDTKGKQVILKRISEGKLGTNKDTKIRLF